MSMLWNHTSLVACLWQIDLSLFLWSTARWGSWGTWQHWSSPLGEAEPGAMGHVAALELTLSARQGPELRDTWQHRSSPQHGDEVQGRGTRGGAGAYLCSEVWSEATTYVAARGCTSYSLSWLRACMRDTRSSRYRHCSWFFLLFISAGAYLEHYICYNVRLHTELVIVSNKCLWPSRRAW
jgi:hypothetical protein